MPDAMMREQFSLHGISGESIKVDDVLTLMECEQVMREIYEDKFEETMTGSLKYKEL